MDRGLADVLFYHKMLSPYDADGLLSVQRCMSSFAPLLEANKNTKQVVFHTSLNPSPEDRITQDDLRKIAEEYMQRMGYGEQPYIVFRHRDIAREHLHIVSLRIDSEGTKIKDSHERSRSMETLRYLERKYGLQPSRTDTELNTARLRKVDYTQSNIKQQLSSVVRAALNRYHCSSFTELRTLLELFNVSIKEQKGTIRGRDYAGILYGALDSNGWHVGVPIKASRIGRDVGYKSLERYFESSKRNIQDMSMLNPLRQAIVRARAATHSLPEFKRQLENEGIAAVVRLTDAGRIYGVTFIDHQTGMVANGSRLGSGFSANSFERHFNSADISGRSSFVSTGGRDTAAEHMEIDRQQDIAHIISLLFDIIDARQAYEEPIVREKKRRKKRHRLL